MSMCSDSTDICNLGSLQFSNVSPGKLLESRCYWKGNSSDDDMCRIDDKDDITMSEVKLNSSLISDFKLNSVLCSCGLDIAPNSGKTSSVF